MTAATYLQMQTRVLREITRSASDTNALNAVKDALLSAIRFYQSKPFWFLEVSSTLTVLSAARSVALPTDFQRMVCLRHNYNSHDYGQGYGFDNVTFSDLQTTWAQTPALSTKFNKWALFASSVYTDVLAPANQTLKIDYIKGDTTLPSADGSTSVLFDEAQDMVRTRALMMIYQDFLHDNERYMSNEQSCQVFEDQLTTRNNIRIQNMRIS